jgi:hypothetical protein
MNKHIINLRILFILIITTSMKEAIKNQNNIKKIFH